MITVKYPEWVEAQLKILDERIEKIYREYAEIKVRPGEAMRIKKNLYERTKPFVDEKVRLITNCCPKYMVEGVIKESENPSCVHIDGVNLCLDILKERLEHEGTDQTGD